MSEPPVGGEDLPESSASSSAGTPLASLGFIDLPLRFADVVGTE